MTQKQKSKVPSKNLALFTIIAMLSVLLVGLLVFELNLNVLILIDISMIIIITVTKLDFTYDELLKFMSNSIERCFGALVIFMLIGALIAIWIEAGTVPAVIYFSLSYINAEWFLPFGLVLCTLTSLAIGTAWGTIGTVGVALMGMGATLGIPAPFTAGMVISGATFGDKMSPISDTANLAATAGNADLYDHIKSMFKTALPAFLIALVIFYLMGRNFTTGALQQEQIAPILTTLESSYKISWVVFLPMIVLFGMNIGKVPSLPAMMGGIVTGILVSTLYQGAPIQEVFSAINNGVVVETGNAMTDSILNRGGIKSMMGTFSLAFIAIAMGGILDRVGYLRVLIEDLVLKIKNAGTLAIVAIGTTTLGTMSMGDVYLSLVLSGNLFRNVFKEKGYRPELLSRYVEEGGTLTQSLIPWSTSGVFMATTLGVATLSYLPYTLLNWMTPLISIIFSFLGIALARYGDKTEKVDPAAVAK